MRQVPYIGITDFTKAQQVADMRQVLDDEGCDHLLHAGVMMSYKTLHGMESEWSGIFPPKESLTDIFVQRYGVMNVLHYADYDGLSTVSDWLEAIHYAGDDVDAIQFDMPWPDRFALYDLRNNLSSRENPVRFIIQISQRAIDEAGGDQKDVAAKILGYRELRCADYALFDMSGGKGIPMDAPYLRSHIWAALYNDPNLGIAIAGGLGPNTMHLAEPVVREFAKHDISISLDAQSMLRESGDPRDPIDRWMAERYVRKAASLVKSS